jgi:hypothetical protein
VHRWVVFLSLRVKHLTIEQVDSQVRVPSPLFVLYQWKQLKQTPSFLSFSKSLMAWFRSKTCKAGTYNTLCVVPINGLPEHNSEDEWCLAHYNSTRCAPIRNDAQRKMLAYSLTFYNVNGALGVLTVIMVRWR